MLTVALTLLQFAATPLVPAYRIGAQLSSLGGGSARQSSAGMPEEETKDSTSEIALAVRGKGVRLVRGRIEAPAAWAARSESFERRVAGVRGPRGPLGRLASCGRAIRLRLQSHRC